MGKKKKEHGGKEKSKQLKEEKKIELAKESEEIKEKLIEELKEELREEIKEEAKEAKEADEVKEVVGIKEADEVKEVVGTKETDVLTETDAPEKTDDTKEADLSKEEKNEKTEVIAVNGGVSMAEDKKEVKNVNLDDKVANIASLAAIDKRLNKKEKSAKDAELLKSMESDDMRVLAALLLEIRDKNDKELRYAKTQMRTAVFTSILSLIIVIAVAVGVISLIPRVVNIANQVMDVVAKADMLIDQTNDLMAQADTVMQNLQTVTNDVANADLTGMLEDVDSLVVSSEENMAEALKTITDIDIESLNKAITDLNAIVEPLARLFRR